MYSPPTPDEEERFRKEYPSLISLLAAWTVADDRPDEEMLREVLREHHPEALRRAVEQGRKFLQQKELPWTLIVDTANYSFAFERDAREWLIWLLDQIESALSAKAQPSTASCH